MLAFIAAVFLLFQPVNSLDDARRALRDARPGDRIELATGTYDGSLWIEDVRGREGAPIVLTGADPAAPPVIRGETECIHLSGCEWITVEGLVLQGARGNGLNADDAGRISHPARGVTIRSLTVRDIGDPAGNGNWDGIKLSGLTGFLLENCTVERWGGGGSGIDMVGCSDGRIMDCVLRHEEGKGASGVQAKGGSRDILVERCRFEDAGSRAINIGGSTGLAYFRPKPEGHEARNITVSHCTIRGSDAAIAFVGIDGATVKRCTIVNPRRWVLRILQETREPGFVACRGGRMEQNIIVFEQRTAGQPNISDQTNPASFVFDRNLWYCSSDPAHSRPALPSQEAGGTYGLDPRLADMAGGDYSPASDGPGAGLGADLHSSASK